MEEQHSISSGAQYLLQFAANVEQYTAHQAQYGGLLIEQYKVTPESSDEDKKKIMVFIQKMRYYAFRCITSYVCIYNMTQKTKSDDYNQIMTIQEKFEKELFPDFQTTQKFSILMNTFLLSNVIKDFMKTSETFVQKMVS